MPAILICLSVVVFAQPPATSDAKSVLTIHVGKSGMLSAAGHNHEIAAAIKSCHVDTNAHTVELRVETNALRVADKDVSDGDRATIQSTMLGPEVLDAGRFPEIVFRSTGADAAGSGAWKLSGDLTLHGQSRPVTVDVRETDGHFTGSSAFKQTDFGIKPVKAGGGAVRVKDEVRIEFDIYLTKQGGCQ